MAQLDAAHFADEATRLSPPAPTLLASHFADEASRLAAPVPTLLATHFADEGTKLAPPGAVVITSSLVATHFADENQIIPANPYRMMTRDPVTGEYVAAPWYIWNGTTWVQAV